MRGSKRGKKGRGEMEKMKEMKKGDAQEDENLEEIKWEHDRGKL